MFIPATVTYEGETYTVTEVGDGAFYGCTGITSVTVPEGVRTCGLYAFRGCSSLKTVTLPNSMVSLQAAVFEGCSSLRSIDLPDNLREMRLEVFAGCSGLTSIDIPDGVTCIERNAFSGCTSLVTVNLPDNLTSIEDDAFRNCSSLTSVYANMATPCTLRFSVFLSINKDCKLYVPFGKKDAYIAAGWTEDVFKGGIYEMDTFTYTYAGKTLTYKITDTKNVQVGDGSNPAISTSASGALTIPSSVSYWGKTYTVKGIGISAFQDCSSLTSVTIPNSVTSIDDQAFTDCI